MKSPLDGAFIGKHGLGSPMCPNACAHSNAPYHHSHSPRCVWPQAQHALVARWTKSFDLFGKKMVLVPINEALHWCVLLPLLLRARLDRPSTCVTLC
jgi:hypothetical protein